MFIGDKSDAVRSSSLRRRAAEYHGREAAVGPQGVPALLRLFPSFSDAFPDFLSAFPILFIPAFICLEAKGLTELIRLRYNNACICIGAILKKMEFVLLCLRGKPLDGAARTVSKNE